MRSERWRLVNPHLDRALDLSGEERRGYLAVLASEDSTLAADLESLLGEERALREEKYLAIRRKVLGPVHHETGTSLSDLGLLLRKKGDSSGAEALLRQALEVTRTSSGPRHPDVGTSLSSLAMTLDERGDYRAAEAMLRESLDIVQDSLGREHPGNAQKLAYLACVLRAQGKLAEARSEEALALSRPALGMDHPTVVLPPRPSPACSGLRRSSKGAPRTDRSGVPTRPATTAPASPRSTPPPLPGHGNSLESEEIHERKAPGQAAPAVSRDPPPARQRQTGPRRRRLRYDVVDHRKSHAERLLHDVVAHRLAALTRRGS